MSDDYELKELQPPEGANCNYNINTPQYENNNNNNNNTSGNESPNILNSENQFNQVANELENDSKQFFSNQDPEMNVEHSNVAQNEQDFKLRSYFENSQRIALGNGQKPKKMGISIRNLTVVGKGADISVISDLSTPFVTIFNLFRPSTWRKSSGSTFDILHDVTLFNRDAEMLLVLGRPGAGCSTLLRVISNQRSSYVSVSGDVTYGGINFDEWKNFKGESIYTPEEDTHHPTLTVRETLNFALKCKTIHNRLPDEKKKTFRKKIYDLLVGMFGISKQSDTLVGNEFIRGLSGGERKRLTITEAMVSSASITCYDCSTRGLDAASALDYAKSIRIMSDTLHKTTIASFYQASDSIFNLFNNVAILEKGRLIYFGPVGLAKQYFLDLGFDCEPRKSTPDFLTGVTNPQERKVRPGFEGRAPETSSDFEKAWKSSDLYQVMLQQQLEYEKKIELEQPSTNFIEQIRNENSKTNPTKSIYTTSYFTQVRALIARNSQIIWGDRFALISKYISIIVQTFVYASLFYNMKSDVTGLFNRGGAIYAAILFNAFVSAGELGLTFYGRRILQKQHSYAMYRPSALHIAMVITDIPLTAIQVTIFSVIVYFMYGLQVDAGKFFIFLFTIFGSTLSMVAFFRALGNLSPSLYVSQNILNVFILFMFTYGGYSIPKNKMHPWFSWYFWINPFSFPYKALMANEFGDMNFTCNDQTAIPNGNYIASNGSTMSYQDQYRACPSAGAIEGQMVNGEFYVAGSNYIDAALDFKSDDRTLNVIITFLWWIFFVIINMIALELFDWTSGGMPHKVYKRGKAPKINDDEEERQQNAMVENATSKMKDTLKMRESCFTWNHIHYTVQLNGKDLLLLNDVEGWIKPGQMTALMGSSGAGKTTLLDVLAKRKTMGTVTGKCLLNGKELNIDFERITGYVEQMDVHNPGLTVREALRFSAKLRQEPTVSLQDKYEYVEQVLEMMEMKHLGDALIGSLETGIGISVEERKRLTIGIELVAKPHILFLDEPTSGLDSQSSYNIVKFIRKLADAGMPLVCTIHQPSSVLFEYFDRILLLAKGGKTVYYGDIGEKSKTLTSYFERNGVRSCTESENPAEYILEAIGAGTNPGVSTIDWPEVWKQSPELQDVQAELASLETAATVQISSDDQDHGPPREFATSIWYQTWEVYKRLNLIWWRDMSYVYGIFTQAAASGLIIGFTFWNLDLSSSDMNQRVFFIFEILFLGILYIFIAIPQFLIQKAYFKKDYASKFYSWCPFAISIVIVELPFVAVAGTICFFCSFWTAGIYYNGEYDFYFYITFILFLFICVSLGQVVSAFCFNVMLAQTILPLLLVMLFLFCGVLVPYEQIPNFWKFVYHSNPCRYFLEGVVTSVLKNVFVDCSNEDLTKFSNPTNLTCKEYFKPTYGNVRAVTKGDESECGYCVFKSGEEYYKTLGWSYENRLRNYGILWAFFIFNIIMVVSFVYLTKKPNR
nr:ABC transporter AbcG10 [Dictyostelium discoideum]